MELKSLFNNFKGKSGKFITFILIGMLLLIIIMPVKNKSGLSDNRSKMTNADFRSDNSTEAGTFSDTYTGCASYYEESLKKILEKSYGEGTMNVMVSLKAFDDNRDYIGDYSGSSAYCVDGVLVVADVKDKEAAADIAFAVCALFNLPAHKVAVLIKN